MEKIQLLARLTALKDVEVWNGRLNEFVIEHLQEKFSAQTVKEMPIIGDSFYEFTYIEYRYESNDDRCRRAEYDEACK